MSFPSSLLDDIKRLKKQFKPKKTREAEFEKHKMEKSITKSFIQDKSNLSRTESCSSSDFRSNPKKLKIESSDDEMKLNFEKASFCFPMKDIQLTNKRIQIFTGIIRSCNGFVKTMEESFKNGVDFYIVSTSMPKAAVLKSIEQTIKNENKKVEYKILRFQYIIDCQKLGFKIGTQEYELFTEEQTKPIIQRESEYFQKVQQRQDISQQNEKRKFIHVDFEAKSHDETVSLKKFKEKKSSQQFIEFESLTEKKSSANKNTLFLYPVVDKNHFACQKGSSQSQFTINQFIYDQLMDLYNIYQTQKDTGRKIAYLKAASAIKSFKKQINSEKDIMQLRGIGKKIEKKIKQLLETGRIQKLQKLKQNQENQIVQELSRVWGIGVTKAKQLYAKGIKSLDMLKQRSDLLNKNQKIGLDYVSEFEQRIPRLKVERIFQFVKMVILSMTGQEDTHLVEVCGSFRRGKATCGDIDVIITRKDGIFQPHLLFNLITNLQKLNFLTHHLSIPSNRNLNLPQSMSYMGVCQFQTQIHHRIDIKYYPQEQFPFATLYFTGSDMFNRSMRLFARKKGYSLSDHGIVPVQRNGVERIWTGKQISLCSQEAIFEFLGLDWKSPQERNL